MEEERQVDNQKIQQNLVEEHERRINALSADNQSHSVQIDYNNEIFHNQEQEVLDNSEQQFARRTIIRGDSNLVWIFLIQDLANYKQQQEQTMKLYSRYNKIPFCSNIKQAKQVLYYQDYQTSKQLIAFKFIVDKKNAKDLLQLVRIDSRIIEVNLFLPVQSDGIQFFTFLKRQSKEIFCRRQAVLKELFETNKYSILNSRRFTENESGIYLDQVKTECNPLFIKLNGISDSQKTKYIRYRKALYQAIVMQKNQRKAQLLQKLIKQFNQILKKKIQKGQLQQTQKIREQSLIKEFKLLSTKILEKQKQNSFQAYKWSSKIKDQAKHIIQFYSSQSFISKQINSMLRQTLNNEKTFQVPFSQIYKSISYFFKKEKRPILQKYGDINNEKPIKYLYRAFYCDPKIIQSLKQGDFFQILGFVSTSKNKLIAVNNFGGRKNYYFFKIDISILYQLEILDRQEKQNILKYEHGMIDFQKSNIEWKCKTNEEQVLINALNVYQVINRSCKQQIGPENEQIFIEIKYGSILNLILKKKRQEQLSDKQNEVLKNYNYCSQILDDNFKLLKLKQRIAKNIKNNQKISTNDYLELSQLYQKQGNLKLARQNATKTFDNMSDDIQEIIKSIKSQNQQVLQARKQQKKGLQSNQQSCGQLFVRLEDYQYSTKCFKNLIQLYYEQQNWLKKAQAYQKNAFLQKVRGKYKDSIQTYKKSQQILLQKLQDYQKRQDKINQNYCCNTIKQYLCFLRCFCNKISLSDCFSHWAQQYKAQQGKRKNEINNVQIQRNKAFKTQQYEIGLNLLLLIQNTLIQLGDKTKNQELRNKYKNKLKQTQEFRNMFPNREDFRRNQIQLLSNVSIQYIIQNSTIQFEQIKNSFIQQIESNLNNQSEKNNDLVQTCKKMNQLTFSRIKPKSRLMPSVRAQRIANQNETHQNFQQNSRLIAKTLKQSQRILESQQNIRYTQNPKLEQINNYISYLHFLQNNLQQSKKKLQESLNNQNTKKHTEGAKKYLLLSKIAFSRGQTLQAFKNIDNAKIILKTALIKNPKNLQYWAIYECFPMKYEIEMHLVKVHNAQLRSDLSLPIIRKIQQKFSYELYSEDYLIELFTEKGKVGLIKQQFSQYENNMKMVVKKIQQQQKYCSETLQALCFFYIQCIENKRRRNQYLEKAQSITYWLNQKHPSLWIYFYAISLKQKQNNDPSKEKQNLIKSYQFMKKKYKFAKDSIIYIQYNYLIMKRLWQLKGVFFEHVNYYGPAKISQQLGSLIFKLKQSLKQSRKRLNLIEGQYISPRDDKRKLYEEISEKLKNQIQFYLINQSLIHENSQSHQNINFEQN